MYHLLPFRFKRLSNKEILVNEVGDFLFVPAGTARLIVDRAIDVESELHKDLFSNFFISETKVPYLIDNLAARYRTKKAFLNDFTALHIFVLTLRCNQNCQYCQASSRVCDKHEYDMTYETLEHSISLMFESPSPAITVEFQGGEPTLVPYLIKFAIEKVEELNSRHRKKITYVICTNLTNLKNEILDICLKHNVLISTSLDGPKFIHDANRGKEGSYDEVIRGIKKSRLALGNDRVSALMTTSELSLNYPKEIVDNYIENGFSNIFLRALNPYGNAKGNDWKSYYERFTDFFEQSLNYIIELNKQGTFIVEDFTSILVRKMLTPFNVGFVDLQSPAGIINSVIVYNYDGFVYASDESRMLAEHGDFTFRLGKVTDSYQEVFYGDKVQKIAKVWANEALPGCSECAYQTYCGADPVRNYTQQGDMIGFRPASYFCSKNMKIIDIIFEMLINRKEEVLPIFKKWIS